MDQGGGNRRDPRDVRNPQMPGLGGIGDLQGLAEALGGLAGGQRRDARDPRGALTLSGRDARDVREMGGRDAGRGDQPIASPEVIQITGQARVPGGGSQAEAVTLKLDPTGFIVEMASGRPIRAGYRDLSLVAIQDGTALLVLGEGPGAQRFILERFGDRLGPLVRELRERRLRQRLVDALVKIPEDPADLVEFEVSAPRPGGGAPVTATGVGQLLVHPWGFVVAPVDERQAWIRFRRGLIVEAVIPEPGTVRVSGPAGTLVMHGLGKSATRLRDALGGLRDGAYADAARFVEELLPDAPFTVRDRASSLLVDGRPTRPDELGAEAWPLVEAAVLGEPTFAESYSSLVTTAGPNAPRWVAMSPVDPGGAEPKIWFLIAMPGNLVAMELVTAGAHATYFFRVVPRASYGGQAPEALGGHAGQAVLEISEALVDSRFLREPIALPADQLRLAKYLRYRLALAALPTLAAARARFVARVVHRDAASWSSAVADLIKWHGACRDDAAEWPGRAAQEKQVLAAAGESGDEADAGEEPAAETEEPGSPTPSGTGS